MSEEVYLVVGLSDADSASLNVITLGAAIHDSAASNRDIVAVCQKSAEITNGFGIRFLNTKAPRSRAVHLQQCDTEEHYKKLIPQTAASGKESVPYELGS